MVDIDCPIEMFERLSITLNEEFEMPKEPEERYLEWMEREEEMVGFDWCVRASEDVEEARKLLYSELGYEPTEAQTKSFMEAGVRRYEQLPALGVRHGMVEMKWGYQSTYRDIITGRYIKAADVVSALRTFF